MAARRQVTLAQAPRRRRLRPHGAYDSAIASWFAFADQGQQLPNTLPLAMSKASDLRYGENPHQSAALYVPQLGSTTGVAGARQVGGKELSYNNLNDADAALELLSEFRVDDPACVIVKHANPCGVARGATLAEAYQAAFECDSVSAFGGIVAVNRPLDGETARAITGIFTEVVIAPDADDEALAVFAARRTCGCCSSASCLIRAGRVSCSRASLAGCWSRRATMASSCLRS
jgi:phosphoribosylaminoimidazolecarboxamide formyltransferase/IMP cyclohydrolase